MSPVLTAEHVSKQYRIRRSGPVTLKELFLERMAGSGGGAASSHWALHDISLAVEQGRGFGVIGHNGAGKTTLLRLLYGLGQPTSGSIRRGGRVSGVLELGSGFHPDMTGRENIITVGVLSGFTAREMEDRQAEIIAFAELEEAIDRPVRTYSTGMYLRLAFAAAMHVDADVLIVDEVLAVGDARFQQKCRNRIEGFLASGGTLLFASHVPEQVSSLCEEVLVLEEGRVALQADPKEAQLCYADLMRRRTQRRIAQLGVDPQPCRVERAGSRHGTQEATIAAVSFLDAQGRPAADVKSGDPVSIVLDYRLTGRVSDMTLSLSISNDTVQCFEVIVPSLTSSMGRLEAFGSICCQLPSVCLLPGRYFVNVGLYPPDWAFTYDYHWQMHELRVFGTLSSSYEVSGVAALNPVWSLHTTDH